MAATGKTPILLYGSTTATNAPVAGNLTNSSDGCEIAINVADKNLFFKDSTNVVNTVPIRQSSASSNGWLSSTDWSTFNGKAPSFTYTTGYIPFGQGTATPTQNINLFWDNTNKYLGVGTAIPSATVNSAPRYGAVPTNNSVVTGVSLYNDQDNVTGDGVKLLFDHSFRTPGSQTRGAYLNSFSESVYSGSVGLKFGVTNSGSFLDSLYLKGTGDVSVTTGNLVIGTSGKGIDFSATAGTGTSELLADYEEGTFTPTVTPQSGSLTSYSASGIYTKIGRIVSIQVTITLTTVGTAGGGCAFTLPYTNGATASVGVGREDALIGSMLQIRCPASGTTASFFRSDNTSVFLLGNGAVLTGQLTYSV